MICREICTVRVSLPDVGERGSKMSNKISEWSKIGSEWISLTETDKPKPDTLGPKCDHADVLVQIKIA